MAFPISRFRVRDYRLTSTAKLVLLLLCILYQSAMLLDLGSTPIRGLAIKLWSKLIANCIFRPEDEAIYAICWLPWV